MATKYFNYGCNLSSFRVDASEDLLKRVFSNIEREVSYLANPDCLIKIQERTPPVEIIKDKRFKYETIENPKGLKDNLLRYYRYDTHIRTIKQVSFGSYEVNSNAFLDENSVLICVRNHLSNSTSLSNCVLTHASLIKSGDQGIFIPGESMQGKTSLMLYFLQKEKAKLIGDENILLDFNEDSLIGRYVPKTIRVRFPVISRTNLSPSLENISLTDATQYLDSDFIHKKLETRDYSGEYGLSFSRKAVCDLLNVSSEESSEISTVVFPKYCYKKESSINKLSREDGLRRLSQSGLIKKTGLNTRELEETIFNTSKINPKKLNFFEVTFSGIETLLERGLNL